MTNKPDFIVDPSGNVQDVRGSKNASGSQSYSSQNSRAGVPSGEGLHGTGKSISGNQRTPGGVIIIPIGLILTLLIALCRMVGGTSIQNRYSEAEVNSVNSGLYHYDEGNYQEAIRQFDIAIASAPDMGEHITTVDWLILPSVKMIKLWQTLIRPLNSCRTREAHTVTGEPFIRP